MKARAVLFDLGGVLTTSPLAAVSQFLSETGVPPEGVYEWFTNPDGAWARFETGALDLPGALAQMEREAATQGLRLDVPGFVHAFLTGFAIREPMIALVRALRGRTRVGCLTNTVTLNGVTELFGLNQSALFDVIVASCEVGMRKPDPAIYQLACQRLGVAPQQIVFLDDYRPNIEAANSAGMVGVLFESEAQAARDLQAAAEIRLL